MKARKKPVEIGFFRYAGPDSLSVVTAYDRTVEGLQSWGAPVEPTGHWGENDNYELFVGTLEDGKEGTAQVRHIASVGDFIIRGVAGEFYPCKPEIFAATYDILTPEPSAVTSEV